MFKKLILAGMAIAAFAAFAVAPAASASPVLTDEGKAVEVGKTIIGTNTGITIFTSALEVKCSTAHITGTVTKNSGTKIEGTVLPAGATFKGTGAGEDCTSPLGSTHVTLVSELCLVSAAAPADSFAVTGCGGAPVVFTLEVTGTGVCKYSATTINGTYSTGVTPTPVTVSEQEAKKTEGGFFCPASGKLDMVFDLYTDNLPTETPLTIS
jgi:hypothetical protein